jgi:TAG lipase/steryl ester hydrolase/phospholipase A2/LPA acyltransferase
VEKSGTAMLKNLFSKGAIHEIEEYMQRLERLLGNTTFEQAYARSGRILNVAVTSFDTQEPPRLLNYLTAPHVLIRSAVAASSAFPWLFKPQELYQLDSTGRVVPVQQSVATAGQQQFLRRWADGSLEEDLPMMGLGALFNVNQFLVSQSNPYLLPVLGALRLLPHKVQQLVEWELKHRMGQLLHIWPRNRLLKLLCQPWEGDINFVLPFTSFAIHRSALNFTRAEIVKAMREGQRAVWGKLAVLRSSCAIEVAIDAELKALTLANKAQHARQRRAAAAGSGGGGARQMRRGMPSWLHMQVCII